MKLKVFTKLFAASHKSSLPADLAQARAVKKELATTLGQLPEVVSVGLVQHPAGAWVVKVSFSRLTSEVNLPAQIDGVDIVTEVIGPIRPQC